METEVGNAVFSIPSRPVLVLVYQGAPSILLQVLRGRCLRLVIGHSGDSERGMFRLAMCSVH
jgi:hypothetical protein